MKPKALRTADLCRLRVDLGLEDVWQQIPKFHFQVSSQERTGLKNDRQGPSPSLSLLLLCQAIGASYLPDTSSSPAAQATPWHCPALADSLPLHGSSCCWPPHSSADTNSGQSQRDAGGRCLWSVCCLEFWGVQAAVVGDRPQILDSDCKCLSHNTARFKLHELE